ncbi:MAG: esterase/lipase family protein [Victivallaceae bacterium]
MNDEKTAEDRAGGRIVGRVFSGSRNFLSSHLLNDEFERAPDAVIRRICDEFMETHDRRRLEVLVQLTYRLGLERSDGSGAGLKYFVASAYFSYIFLFDQSLPEPSSKFDPVYFMVSRYYKYSLLHIFEYLKDNNLLDSAGYTLPDVVGPGFFVLAPENPLPKPLFSYSTVEPCDDYRVDNLLVSAQSFGLGLPLAATNNMSELKDDGSHIFASSANPVTMILDFPAPNRAQLRFFQTMKTRTAEVAGTQTPLETDISTPLAVATLRGSFWNDLLSMLDPDRIEARSGLYMIGDYNPDKIPVVFVHGLMSSPRTWLQMVNYLLSDRRIADNYQFMFYYYSTGQPVLYSACMLREELDELYRRYGNSPKFKYMVIVGHSMGGLLTDICDKNSNREFANSMLKGHLEEVEKAVTTPEQKQFIESMLLFSRPEYLSRVVFMAVPHRGSDMAQWDIARWGADLIRMPTAMIGQIGKHLDAVLVTISLKENNDPIYIASGIDNLDPDNQTLKLLEALPYDPAVPCHSIIGNREQAGVPAGSDGIVPYWSSHIDNAVSEMVVKSGHSVQQTAPAIEELRRILLLHLVACGILQ